MWEVEKKIDSDEGNPEYALEPLEGFVQELFMNFSDNLQSDEEMKEWFDDGHKLALVFSIDGIHVRNIEPKGGVR